MRAGKTPCVAVVFALVLETKSSDKQKGKKDLELTGTVVSSGTSYSQHDLLQASNFVDESYLKQKLCSSWNSTIIM